MIRRLLLAVLLASLTSAARAEEPRVTLSLSEATLPEVLQALNRLSGVEIQSDAGAGGPAFRPDPGAPRASLRWEKAPLVRAIRDVCAAFDQSVSIHTGEGRYWLRTGAAEPRSEVVAEGIAFSLLSIQQGESLSPGPDGAPLLSRSLRLEVLARSLDGEPGRTGPLTRLQAVDEDGRRHTLRVTPGVQQSVLRLPDEVSGDAWITWPGPHARRLRRVEGEVELGTGLREHRLALPLSGPLPWSGRAGPARVTLLRRALSDTGAEVSLRLEWPEGAAVLTSGASVPRVEAQSGDGRRVPLWTATPLAGGTVARGLTLDWYRRLEAPAAGLELVVPVAETSGRRVAFHFDDVVMPYRPGLPVGAAPAAVPAQPLTDLPEELYDPAGGSLRLPSPDASAHAWLDVSIGLQRRSGGGWSGLRWVEREVGTASFLLRDLAPGRYRITLRCWRRLPDGSRRRFPAADRVLHAEVRPGTESTARSPGGLSGAW